MISPTTPTRLETPSKSRDDAAADPEEGAATAEYAIVIMAAVAFGGLLVAIMRSDGVSGMLTDLVRSALSFAG